MGISVWQLLIVLAIVLVVFGAKRLRGLGGDLGSAVKSFREAVRDPGARPTPPRPASWSTTRAKWARPKPSAGTRETRKSSRSRARGRAQ